MEEKVTVLFQKLCVDAIIPTYAHAYDAGFDLHVIEKMAISPGDVKILPTGLAVALPPGCELQIRLRSSIALQTPLIIPNAPATVDAGYRGELGIIVRNVGTHLYVVQKGDRIAQGVLARICRAEFQETDALPPSERGSGGYGSSGR